MFAAIALFCFFSSLFSSGSRIGGVLSSRQANLAETGRAETFLFVERSLSQKECKRVQSFCPGSAAKPLGKFAC